MKTKLLLVLIAVLLFSLAAVIPAEAGTHQKRPNALGWCGSYAVPGYALSVSLVKSGGWRGWFRFTLFEAQSNHMHWLATYYLKPVQYGAPVGNGWKADVTSATYCPSVYR